MDELEQHYENLIFTLDAPDDIPGWGLRANLKGEDNTGWFGLRKIAAGCKTKQDAIDMALSGVIHGSL